MSAESVAFIFQAAGRLGLYLCLLLLLGVGVFRGVVLTRLSGQKSDGRIRQLDRTASQVATWTAVGLVFVCAWRLFAQAYAIFGVDEGVTFESLKIVGLQTPWGSGWGFQTLAALFVTVAAFLTRRIGLPAWYLLLLSALGLGFTLPLTGHAMSQPAGQWVGVGLQAVHVTAAAVWIGLLFVVWSFGLKVVPVGESAAWHARVIEVFSPIALAAVGTLVVAGVVSAFVFLDSWSQLTHTAYGRTLLGKVAFFAGTGLVGAYNWRILRPRIGKAGNERALRRSMAAELVLALIVLGITAVLVALPLEH